MKIALFKHVKYGFLHTADSHYENISNYVRVSEYVDIEFPDLPKDEVVNNQITALKAERQTLQAETEVKLGDIDRKISELLALPHKEEL